MPTSSLIRRRTGLRHGLPACGLNRRIRILLYILIIPLLAACDRQSDSQVALSAEATVPALPAATEDAGEAVAELLAATVSAPDGQTDAAELILIPTPVAPPSEQRTVDERPDDAPPDDQPTSIPAEAAEEESATAPADVARVTAALINVRAAPSFDAPVLTTAPGGLNLAVVGESDDGLWLQVCCADGITDEQWVSRDFVELSRVAAEAGGGTGGPVRDGAPPPGTVTGDLVNVRGGPATNFPIVTRVNRGQSLTLLARTPDGEWLRICCVSADPDVETWMSSRFVRPSSGAVAWAESTLPEEDGPPPPVAPAAAVQSPSAGGQAAALAAAPAPGLPGDGGFGAPGGTNPFTGLPLNGGKIGQRPVFVCINNDFAARPQLGISQADVMVEYLMEGFGITRFAGLFYGDDVAQIGPIRSARLINYYLGSLYNSGLVCSGASDRVRYSLKHEAPFPYLDIDLDDPSNARYSASVGSDYRTRLRTNTGQIQRWLADWGVQQPASVRGFTFGALPAGGRPAIQVAIPYPAGTGSQVDYRYDGSGRYLRSLGGSPHLDGNSGAQVAVDNVIVQVVPHEITDIVEDSLGSLSIRLNVFGSGRAIVIRDGQAFDATWRSDSRGDMPRFYAADGSEIPLKPGRSWISVVPTDYTISIR